MMGRIGPEIATAVLARDGEEARRAEGGARRARAAGAADQASVPAAQRDGGRLGRHGRAPETAAGPSQHGRGGDGGEDGGEEGGEEGGEQIGPSNVVGRAKKAGD